jgi:tryptophan synthase alpha chain
MTAPAPGGPAAARRQDTGTLETHLRARRDEGRKLLVPYVTGGMGADWIEAVHAVADAGADAVEIGIPFSDPMIDGPTIQEASLRALQRGTTPGAVLDALARADVAVPLCVMTYYNIAFRAGLRRFARSLAEAGVAGAIIPDLPLEEAAEWCVEADDAGVATVLLVAPSTPPARASAICDRSRGFVYGVGVMGVTGERATLASSAGEVGRMLRPLTDRPVCIGIGVSTPAQAAQACVDADGVVVGSAIVRRLLDGEGPEAAGEFVRSLRAGIDAAPS